MNVLVVGKGGREHTLAWALRRSDLVDKLYAAPGNPGIAALGECVSIAPEDARGIAGFAREHGVDLVVVGPDGALEAGVVDAVENLGIRAFGPTRAAAEIEWSKAFSKRLMREEGIPTAAFEVFSDLATARAHVDELGAPIVIKADGLAAGKGALVCRTVEEAMEALDSLMTGKRFGEAGRKVVVEAFMEGEEASVFAFTDGERVLPLVPSQDHKPIYDGDEGPNTGGMGAYAPAPVIDETALKDILERIIEPAVLGMKHRGRPFRGVLYCGIMMTAGGRWSSSSTAVSGTLRPRSFCRFSKKTSQNWPWGSARAACLPDRCPGSGRPRPVSWWPPVDILARTRRGWKYAGWIYWTRWTMSSPSMPIRPSEMGNW